MSLALAIDSCKDLWAPAEAAKVNVPLIGVLAGFMFSAIVVIVTMNRREPQGEKEAALALRLQIVALMTAIVAAHANINIAGERVCLRARTEWVLSAGMLWNSVLMMTISVLWLLIAYRWSAPDLLRLLIGGAYFVIFGRLIGALLSAVSYVSDTLPGDHAGFHVGAWLFAAMISATTLLVAVRSRRPAHSDGWKPRVNLYCRLAVGSLVVSFVGFDFLASTDARVWDEPSPAQAYIYGALTLVPPLALLPFVVRTIPSRDWAAGAPVGARHAPADWSPPGPPQGPPGPPPGHPPSAPPGLPLGPPAGSSPRPPPARSPARSS